MGRKVYKVDINLICEALDCYFSSIERRASELFKAGNQTKYQQYAVKLAKVRDLKQRLTESIVAATNNSLTSNSAQKSGDECRARLPVDEPIKLTPINTSPVSCCPYCFCSNVKELHLWERTMIKGQAYNFQKGFDCGYVVEIEAHGQAKEIGRCNSKEWLNR